MNTLLIIPEVFGVSLEVYLILFVLTIPSFFFYRFLFKKIIIESKTLRIITTLVSSIVTSFFIYIIIILVWFISSSYYPSKDFDKQTWKINAEKRYEMSADIIENKILIGKTKEQVKMILGEPDGFSAENCWEYCLGYVPGILGSIDPDFLDITFKNNKVIKVEQHQS